MKRVIATERAKKMKLRLQLKEADVQRSVGEFLELDGWRAIRTELTVQRERGRVVGERGMPDYLFIRYSPGWKIRFEVCGRIFEDDLGPLHTEVLWIEFKAPGEKPKAHQLEWHSAERARGATVLVVDDIDAFWQWYTDNGYARRLS